MLMRWHDLLHSANNGIGAGPASCCWLAVQDSDSVWSLSPPARSALLSVLHESSAALSVSWTVVRSAPPPSTHGNPICTGTAQVPLAGLSRMQLLDMLQVGTDALDPAFLCWSASCTARLALLLEVHCFAEGVQSCPALLATMEHGEHWCCKCTALLKSLDQGLRSWCEPDCSWVIW